MIHWSEVLSMIWGLFLIISLISALYNNLPLDAEDILFSIVTILVIVITYVLGFSVGVHAR